jgi:hypothetical protein
VDGEDDEEGVTVAEAWTVLDPELRFWMIFISYFAVAARVSWVRHQERRRLPIALALIFLALNVLFILVGPADLAIGLMSLILAAICRPRALVADQQEDKYKAGALR